MRSHHNTRNNSFWRKVDDANPLCAQNSWESLFCISLECYIQMPGDRVGLTITLGRKRRGRSRRKEFLLEVDLSLVGGAGRPPQGRRFGPHLGQATCRSVLGQDIEPRFASQPPGMQEPVHSQIAGPMRNVSGRASSIKKPMKNLICGSMLGWTGSGLWWPQMGTSERQRIRQK